MPNEFVAPPKFVGDAPRPLGHPARKRRAQIPAVGDRGAEPSELRVQLPIKFELVINLRTAKALGLMVQLALRALTR
jgi:hypothetical protein